LFCDWLWIRSNFIDFFKNFYFHSVKINSVNAKLCNYIFFRLLLFFHDFVVYLMRNYLSPIVNYCNLSFSLMTWNSNSYVNEMVRKYCFSMRSSFNPIINNKINHLFLFFSIPISDAFKYSSSPFGILLNSWLISTTV